MKNIVVVVPSYNNKKWYERNLASIISQNYPNFRVIYIDDCSPDGTGELVETYIVKHKQQDKIKLIRNTERKGAMHNLYDMIHSCDDNDVVVTADGDDWLAHAGVLARINSEYQNENVWVTYGSYMDSLISQGGVVGHMKKMLLILIHLEMSRGGRAICVHFMLGCLRKLRKKIFLTRKGNFWIWRGI